MWNGCGPGEGRGSSHGSKAIARVIGIEENISSPRVGGGCDRVES